MEDFISNLIANSSSFIGGRTLAPGPVVTSSSRVHGPVVVSMEMEPVATSTSMQLEHGISQPRQPLAAFNNNPMSSATASSSILRTDMSPMIAWLTSQNNCATDSQAFGTGTPLNTQAYESYTSEDYRKRIPKPYIELTERDCAGVVARAIGSIVLHTCNDEFRHQCLTKLGASNSRDVEREIKSRLNAIITQEEQQNQSDSENPEMEQSTVSDHASTTTGLNLQ